MVQPPLEVDEGAAVLEPLLQADDQNASDAPTMTIYSTSFGTTPKKCPRGSPAGDHAAAGWLVLAWEAMRPLGMGIKDGD